MNGARIYVPGRFMTNVKQLVKDVSMDLITSVLPRALGACPTSADKEPDLGLISALEIVLVG